MAKETKPSWGAMSCGLLVGLVIIGFLYSSRCRSKEERTSTEIITTTAREAYWRVAFECAASASEEKFPEVSRLSFEQGEAWWGLIRDKEAIMLPPGTRLESVEPASDGISKIKVNDRTWFVSSGFLEFVEP